MTQHCDRPTDEPRLTLSSAHLDEVSEIIDTDATVRSIVAAAVAQIALCGRTLGTARLGKHRYSELVTALEDALDDGMPAAREIGDDQWS